MAQDRRPFNDFHSRPLERGPLEASPAGAERAPRLDEHGQADYSTDYALAERTETEDRTFADRGRRRDGHSDRVLWAVIVERLEEERRLDLSDVQVTVENGEVTLNGTVKHKADKRRIEDIADIDGVKNVQNNLRPREKRGLF